MRFSVLTPTRKAVLMIVPRAARMRRPVPARGRPPGTSGVSFTAGPVRRVVAPA